MENTSSVEVYTNQLKPGSSSYLDQVAVYAGL